MRLRNGGGLAALAAFPLRGRRQPGLLLHKGFCPPCLYPPFARAGASMRSMGGGLAALAAFLFKASAAGIPPPLTKKEGPADVTPKS